VISQSVNLKEYLKTVTIPYVFRMPTCNINVNSATTLNHGASVVIGEYSALCWCLILIKSGSLEDFASCLLKFEH